MKGILRIVTVFLGFMAIPLMAESYLDTEKNQIVLKNDSATQYKITTWGNISPTGAEKECLSYTTKNQYKNCISYQVVIPNYKDTFGIFVKTELSSQDLIGKTVFKYDFTTKKITNVTTLLPKDLQNAGNFWLWYANELIGYTTWSNASYAKPSTFSPSIFQ